MVQIDHVALWVFDLEKQKDFYQNFFGGQPNLKYNNLAKGFSSYFLTFSNGTRIELMKKDTNYETPNRQHLGFCHLAFRLKNREQVDTLTEKMQQAGIIVESQPRVTGDGYYESVILDPEKNRIELVAY